MKNPYSPDDPKYSMHQTDELLTRVEINEAIVGMRKGGIIHIYYKPFTIVTKPLQLKMLEIFFDLAEGVDHPFIWEAGKGVRVTREGRVHAQAMERNVPCEASVIVVKNLAQKFIADFYYKYHKPGMLYKVTWNFDKGIEWLHKVHQDAMMDL